MKNQYSGGKALVGNWYEDRLETKNPPQPPIARDKDPELKVTRIKRVPGNDTADRVMPKHTTPEYNTENQAALRRHKQLKPLPSRKMMQFCNFEHMNEKRPLPNAPEYGFGAHFPLKKPQTVSAMSSTMHSSYGGKLVFLIRNIETT
eukprot:jgi/Bigna1/62505/fgenesh1_kg.36_\